MFTVDLDGKKLKIDFEYEANNETYCIMKDHNDDIVSVGKAVCISPDNFEKYIGRRVSMTHMLKFSNLNKPARKKCWDGYFKKSPIRKTVVKKVKVYKNV